VTADQAAQQAASTAARLVACAATRRMPRLISRRLTARLRLARHLTFVVPLCRAATHPDNQALHRQPPQGLSRRTASCTKFLPRLRNGARDELYKWATDLDLPAFSVTAEQAAEQAAGLEHSCPWPACCAMAREATAARNFPDYSVARLLCG